MQKNFEFNISKNEKIISAMSNLLVKVFARRKLFFLNILSSDYFDTFDS